MAKQEENDSLFRKYLNFVDSLAGALFKKRDGFNPDGSMIDAGAKKVGKPVVKLFIHLIVLMLIFFVLSLIWSALGLGYDLNPAE